MWRRQKNLALPGACADNSAKVHAQLSPKFFKNKQWASPHSLPGLPQVKFAILVLIIVLAGQLLNLSSAFLPSGFISTARAETAFGGDYATAYKNPTYRSKRRPRAKNSLLDAKDKNRKKPSFLLGPQSIFTKAETDPNVFGAQGRGHRTMCVRLCDGFYWPVSYSTTRDRFKKDANQCQSSCTAPTKLFTYRNPGQDIEQMVDRRGKPYSKYKNAFRYRSERVSQCTCRAEPWTEEAKARHVKYAQVEAKRKLLAKKRLKRKKRRYSRRKWKKRRKASLRNRRYRRGSLFRRQSANTRSKRRYRYRSRPTSYRR